jgi:hypothetical protein
VQRLFDNHNALSRLDIRCFSSLEFATFMEMKKRLIKTKTIYVKSKGKAIPLQA